jgi:hypothetical protein
MDQAATPFPGRGVRAPLLAGKLIVMSQTQETITLHRLLDPVSRCLTPEVARQIVALRADPELQARVDLLASKCNEGALTAEEREEYELYVRASRFVALLQAKARKLLAQQSSP